jgi:hypothetical protein
MLYKGTWYEEMGNNRNRSTVRGLDVQVMATKYALSMKTVKKETNKNKCPIELFFIHGAGY